MKILKALRELAITALCAIVAVSCIRLTGVIAPAPLQLTATLRSLQTTSDAATGVIAAAKPSVVGLKATETRLDSLVSRVDHRLNDPCSKAGPCGTFADLDRTLATFRGSAGQVEAGLITLNKHSGDLFDQERLTYANMNRAVADLDAAITNPDISATVTNVRRMSEQGVATTANVAAVSAKVRRFSIWKPWTW